MFTNPKEYITIPIKTVEAGAYIYPFYGIHYYFTHPDLWAFYLTIFIPQLVLTLVVYVVMYILFYPIQAAIAVLLSGPAGIITAWFAVLQQSGMVSVFIVTNVLMPEIQRIAFDAVLSREFSDDVVLLGKLRRIVKVPFLVKCGKLFWSVPSLLVFPFVVFKTLLLFLISTIPVMGPCLVIVIQAPSTALQAHARYFTLKGLNKKQIKEAYKANTGGYMGYGIVANILESIPFLGVFFMFTDTVGAALWAVSIEQRRKSELLVDPFSEIEVIEEKPSGVQEALSLVSSLDENSQEGNSTSTDAKRIEG